MNFVSYLSWKDLAAVAAVAAAAVAAWDLAVAVGLPEDLRELPRADRPRRADEDLLRLGSSRASAPFRRVLEGVDRAFSALRAPWDPWGHQGDRGDPWDRDRAVACLSAPGDRDYRPQNPLETARPPPPDRAPGQALLVVVLASGQQQLGLGPPQV